jgi:hypothetical protein
MAEQYLKKFDLIVTIMTMVNVSLIAPYMTLLIPNILSIIQIAVRRICQTTRLNTILILDEISEKIRKITVQDIRR